MPKHTVMDRTGDTVHEFDSADVEAVMKAEERFKELTGLGFMAAKTIENGRHEQIREFDPEANTIFVPALQGG